MPCDEASWGWLCSSVPDSVFIAFTLLAWNEFWWDKYTKCTVETDKGYRSVHPPLSPRASLDIFASMLLDHKPSTRGHCETILFQRSVTVSLLDFLCLTSSKPAARNLFFNNITFTIFLAQPVFISLRYMLSFFFSPHLYILSSSLVLFLDSWWPFILPSHLEACICWNQCHFFLFEVDLASIIP